MFTHVLCSTMSRLIFLHTTVVPRHTTELVALLLGVRKYLALKPRWLVYEFRHH